MGDLRRSVSWALERRRLRQRGVDVRRNTLLVDVEFRGDARIEDHCRLVGMPRIEIGRNFFMNCFSFLKGEIRIGDDVLIGPGTIVWGLEHGIEPGTPICRQPIRSEPIRIGDDVWIASRVVVLKGVTIGSGAVVAAGAVVTRDVPENAIVAGHPARVLRYRGEDPPGAGRDAEPPQPPD